MAATYSLEKLSGSTDGKGVKVAATTAGSATTVHTATSGVGDIDEVTLYATNQDTVAHDLTVCWGGTTAPDNQITVTVQPKAGLVLVCDRLPILNSLVVGAFADTANQVVVYGSVARVDKP